MTGGAPNVLVVDDSAVNRQLLERILTREGYVVTTALDGRQALDHLRNGLAADVVLLDILMPELDGYEVLSELKSTDATRHIPVIMISAVDEVQSVIRCIEAGATDYLPKPFDAAILRARLASSLSEKRLRDAEREYLQQVQELARAAEAVESGQFADSDLEGLAARTDALGHLARVFRAMAREVRAREQRLEQRVAELRIEIDESRQAARVAEITGSDYFQQLRQQTAELRELFPPDIAPES